METPALLFDLDGTLVDTAPDLLLAINAVLASERRSPIKLATLKAMVGSGVRALIERAFAATGASLAAGQSTNLEQRFIAHYTRHLTEGSHIFPQVRDTLERLRRDGARLAVLTNKPQKLAERLLKNERLSQYFDVIRGTDGAGSIKPDAHVVTQIIARLGGAGAGVLMVGDSPVDVATARAAEIPVVLVSYGYTSRPASALGADAVIGSLLELPALLPRLLT